MIYIIFFLVILKAVNDYPKNRAFYRKKVNNLPFTAKTLFTCHNRNKFYLSI